MRELSAIGKEILAFQERLAAEHNYKPVEVDLFIGDVREKYRSALPAWCSIDGDNAAQLRSLDGTLICEGYERIVIGDYGAFVEISPARVCKDNLCCKRGQEYRMSDERFAANVKYLWLTTKDRSDCKIYLQKKIVSYADYQPGMYYISPYEVFKEESV